MDPNIIISLAPLQGITEYPFRNGLQKFIGGVDRFYSPFIRIQKGNEIKPSKLRDILPENNQDIPLVPQVMANCADELISVATRLTDYGYPEINLNMGCPFPMVVKRKLGSGLLPYSDMVIKMLDTALPEISCNLSLKMRLGQTTEAEINHLLPALNAYPLREIIIHPRLGIQQYKGQVHLEAFGKCLNLTKHPVGYNGDINSFEEFRLLQKKFPQVNHWMIGRGLVANPFLAVEIRKETDISEADKLRHFALLHTYLFDHYRNSLSGERHLLMRMLAFWEYFSRFFEEDQKVYKKFKKAKTREVYLKLAAEIFRTTTSWA